MSVLVYTESEGGSFKKVALELTSYAKGVANATGGDVTAVSINGGNAADLGKYGADKVMEINDATLETFNAKNYAAALAQAAKAAGARAGGGNQCQRCLKLEIKKQTGWSAFLLAITCCVF